MQSADQVGSSGTNPRRTPEPAPSLEDESQHPTPTPEYGSDASSAVEASRPTTSGSELDDDTSADMASLLEPDSPAADSLQPDPGGNGGNGLSPSGASLYPRVPDAYQVEHPFESYQECATIDSARTIYAEDVDYVWENGRRYCGDYTMPNDANEQTRQYVLHQAYIKLFDLELTTVPLHDPDLILDIGTGIGEWAIGMAEKYPDCEVFGTDIAPIQPTDQVPFNVEFHIEDAREEWIRQPNTFDLVHLRNMAGAFSDWSFVYRQAFSCLKPGGYIEVLDFDDHWGLQNFLSWFPETSPVRLIAAALKEASLIDGRPKSVEHLDPDLLAAAGFVDIELTQHDVPVGRRENNKYGDDWLFAIVTGVEATCLRLVTKHMGWDPQHAREVCDTVSRELVKMAEDSKRVGNFVVKLKVLVGRKPERPGQWTAQSLNENGDIGDYSEDDSTIENLSIHRSYRERDEEEAAAAAEERA